MYTNLKVCVGRSVNESEFMCALPEVEEDNNGSQYDAAHNDWNQQGHVVELSIYVDWRKDNEELREKKLCKLE